MTIIARLVFWFPTLFFILTVIIYSPKINKNRILLSLPAISMGYFMIKIFNFRHWENISTLENYEIGFVVSTLCLCLLGLYLLKRF